MWVILELGVYFADEPAGKNFVTTDRGAIGTEQVDAEIFEEAAGSGNVSQNAFAGVSLGAAEQADALEVAGYLFGGHLGWYAFVPLLAQGGRETLYTTAELDRSRSKAGGKG